MSKKVELLAFQTFEHFDLGEGCDVEEEHDTIAEAKRRARYVMTDDYMRMGEMSEPLRYVQILVNGEVHSDYERKD